MKEIILRKQLRTPEEPGNTMTTATSLCSAVGVGAFYDGESLSRRETCRLGMEAVALTHGAPEAFLSGAVLTNVFCAILSGEEISPRDLVADTVSSIQQQFGREFGQTTHIWELLQLALTLAVSPNVSHMDAMQTLGCRTAAEVLAGAVYTVATCNRDFDAAMIIAVNHSGRSSAVGAIAGALLGAILDDEALPDFYLESLEAAAPLTELADDMAAGFSEMVGKSLFDMDWDRKYLSTGK
jgi:ADP-ribosylglycohydrolase